MMPIDRWQKNRNCSKCSLAEQESIDSILRVAASIVANQNDLFHLRNKRKSNVNHKDSLRRFFFFAFGEHIFFLLLPNLHYSRWFWARVCYCRCCNSGAARSLALLKLLICSWAIFFFVVSLKVSFQIRKRFSVEHRHIGIAVIHAVPTTIVFAIAKGPKDNRRRRIVRWSTSFGRSFSFHFVNSKSSAY